MNNSRADIEKNYNAAIITLSDKGAAGLRKDESGPAIKQMLEKSGFCKVEEELIMADKPEELKTALIRMCDSCGYNLILTTGGTGLSPRDFTPEATLAVADRNVPGISE